MAKLHATEIAQKVIDKVQLLSRTTRGSGFEEGASAIAGFALSEPASGSDVANLATTAARDGDGWVVNGEKTWISNGGIATWLDDLHWNVLARPFPGAERRLQHRPDRRQPWRAALCPDFLYLADTEGLTVEERIDVIAPHPLARLAFTDMRLPANALIGKSGKGFGIAMSVLDVFRSTVGAAALGLARRNYFAQTRRRGRANHDADENGPEDTIVIYTADHGFSLGHHGISCRMAVFHAAAKLSCASGPGPGIAMHHDGLVSQIDIPNSLAAGRDRAGGKPRIYVERFNRAGGTPLPSELYELDSDPGERHDLAAGGDGAAVASELSAQLKAYFDRHAAPGFDLWSGGRAKSNITKPSGKTPGDERHNLTVMKAIP